MQSSTIVLLPDERTTLFAEDPEGKRVLVSVFLGCHGSYHKYVEEEAAQCPIAAISVSGKTKWDMLDAMIRRAFKVRINSRKAWNKYFILELFHKK